MERFILRFGPATPSVAQLADLHQRLHVVDSTPKMLLFEAAPGELDKLSADFPQWSVAKEVTYQLPERPPQIRKRPSR